MWYVLIGFAEGDRGKRNTNLKPALATPFFLLSSGLKILKIRKLFKLLKLCCGAYTCSRGCVHSVVHTHVHMDVCGVVHILAHMDVCGVVYIHVHVDLCMMWCIYMFTWMYV